jgi:hypothetical protein
MLLRRNRGADDRLLSSADRHAALLILLAAAPAFAQNAVIRPAGTSFDCAADGTVVNAITGEPIARARVNVMAGEGAYSTATDTSGRWALTGMACVTATMQVTRPGFLQNTPNARAGGAIRALPLVSGSPLRDLKTQLSPQSVAFGRVLDDQGDPVMGAQVTVFGSRVVDGRSRFQQAGTGTTNDLGDYRIANLSRGRYILCAHVNQQNGPAQPASQTIPADTCYPGPLEGGAASATDLPAGREAKVDFTMNQVLPVHVRGVVTGLPEGRGSGINLVKRGLNSDIGINLPGAVRDGKFDFRVPPGSYMLTADYFEAGKRLTARVPIEAGSSDIDNVVVHLDAGFTVTGTMQIASQSGQTAPPQFAINMRPSEPVNGTGQLKWDTDRKSFAISDMVPGSYRLDVFPPQPFYVKSATLAGQDIVNNEISISQAAGPIEVVLRDDGGSVEGDVVDANGQPVAAGILLLRGTIRAANGAAQANGHFKLRNVAPGDYTIYAWDEPNDVEYADTDWMRRNGSGGVSVTVTAGQNQQVKLTEQRVPAS